MAAQPQIQVKNSKTGEKRLYRLDQPQLCIGRDLSNYIILDSRTVSRRHAEILQEGHQFFVRDLKSDNGTSLNARRLPPQEKNLLRSGDVIQIEDYELNFFVADKDPVEEIYEITDTDFLEIKMVKNLLKALDREKAPSLEILEGPKAGARFVLEGKNQDVLIGRDPACEFVIDEDVISRKHARLEKRFDTVTLHDLESKNGLYVNRERVGEARLRDGDIIHLGTLGLAFRNPQELSFELDPPRIQPTRPEAPEPSPPPVREASPPGTGPRAAGRLEGPKAARLSSRKAAFDMLKPLLAKFRFSFKFSATEILTFLIAGTVLIGSLWGILRILK